MSTNCIPKLLLTLSASLVVFAAACGGEEEPSARAAASGPAERAALHGAPAGVELPKLIGPKQYDGPPPMLIDVKKRYTAYFEMERGKEFVVDLFADKAPKTVNNFVFLARDGFYDGLDFYEVTLTEDSRAGDPTGTGTGGPGYYIDDEFHPDLFHRYQMVTMDNDGKPDTNGSRLIIIIAGAPQWGFGIETRENSLSVQMNGLALDGSTKDCADPEVECHTVFGQVAGAWGSPSSSRVSMIRSRDPKTATTPGDVIKTIRIEVSE